MSLQKNSMFTVDRNLGLDIARSVAILMVLASHARVFFTNYFDAAKWSIFGVLGVEIFFVLSGFLIGGIMIKDLDDGKWSSLRYFYLRRWFRTLPLYYLILIFFMILYKQFHWEHFVFIQNYRLHAYEFFTASWSLAVEEWFYLLIPLVFLISKKIFKIELKYILFATCFIIICLSLSARIYYTLRYNVPWDFGIRVKVFLRLDSIMFGVMLAGMKVYYKELYKRIIKLNIFAYTFAVVGLTAVGVYYVYRKGAGRMIDNSFFGRTFLFTLIPFIVVFLIMALESDGVVNNWLSKFKMSGIFKFISTTSYSIYLINYDIYYYFSKFNTRPNVFYSLVLFVLSLIVMYTIAYFLYRYYEEPIMNLREKFRPKERKQAVVSNNLSI